MLDTEEERILDELRALPTEHRQEILDLVEFLVHRAQMSRDASDDNQPTEPLVFTHQ
jgi:hypothetical protein